MNFSEYKKLSSELSKDYSWTMPDGKDSTRWANELRFAESEGFELLDVHDKVDPETDFFYNDDKKMMEPVTESIYDKDMLAGNQMFPIYRSGEGKPRKPAKPSLLLVALHLKLA